MKYLTLQANGSSNFQEYECQHCGSTMVIASNVASPYCAYCQSPLEEGTPISRSELTASRGRNLSYVKCVSCDTVFAANSEESAEELAASKYCVNCAGDSLVACDSEGTTLEDESVPESTTEEDTMDDTLNDNEDVKDNLEAGISEDRSSYEDEDTYSELDASTHEDLQWSALDTSEGEQTAMIASSKKTGNPIAIFHKKNAPSSMQALFAQTLFVSSFNEVANTDGLAMAIKAFGGNYFSKKVLTAADIEKAALSNMQATAIPKLIDCCQIAVEGGVKGIYPDVYSTLQKSIVNELVASGVDADRANAAVASTFTTHGSELFGTIVAKAMDLFVKPETARIEAKGLIMQASSSVAPISIEQTKIREAMEKPTIDFGVLNMTASANNSDAERLRRELF